ncbi:MAG: hypothetical protein WC100_01520 [Sterolibacterium sp.]
MSEMTNAESVERFYESMKKTASRCREMGRLTQSPHWLAIATALDGMRAKGQHIIEKEVMSQKQILASVEAYNDQLAEAQENAEGVRHTH